MNNDQPHARSVRSDECDVPQPTKPTPVAHMPRPLTFFLNAPDRTAVLRALRTFDRDRASALLQALSITQTAPRKEGTQ